MCDVISRLSNRQPLSYLSLLPAKDQLNSGSLQALDIAERENHVIHNW